MPAPSNHSSTSTDSPSIEPVSQWSCFSCRRRKLRCNRRQPCAHCSRNSQDCSFPSSGRLPTRQHNPLSPATSRPKDPPQQSELLVRLRRLEGMVWELSAQVDQDKEGVVGTGPAQQDSSDPGKLFSRGRGSLYVSNRIWDLISSGVKETRQSVEDDGEEYFGIEQLDDEMLQFPTPGRNFFWQHEAMGVRDLQPLPSQMPFIWQIFVHNVDPFIKILHVPTTAKMIEQSKGRFSSMTVGIQALLFAISLAAVTSLTEEEVSENFSDDKSRLLAQLTFGAEQALSRAGILSTTDFAVLQAFLIYVEVVEQRDGPRAVWNITGLLLRIALCMGLHRDGSHFPRDVSPLDAELRRRVWWHICFADTRTGDCQVLQAGLNESMFDTAFPGNLDDADFGPDVETLPEERKGFTDTSLCRIRCYLWRFDRNSRRFNTAPPGSNADENNVRTDNTLTAAKQKLLAETKSNLEAVLSSYCGSLEQASATAQELSTYTRTLACLELGRFELMICLADDREATATASTSTSTISIRSSRPDQRRQSFLLAFACLDHENRMREGHWGWTLRDSIPWHILTALLIRLGGSPWCPTYERVWHTALKTLDDIPSAKRLAPLWKPLKQLIASVECHRNEEIQRLRGEGGAQPAALDLLGVFTGMGAVAPELSTDGGLGFDLAEAEARLALEEDVSTGKMACLSAFAGKTGLGDVATLPDFMDSSWLSIGRSASEEQAMSFEPLGRGSATTVDFGSVEVANPPFDAAACVPGGMSFEHGQSMANDLDTLNLDGVDWLS